jgi:hypothetical protein
VQRLLPITPFWLSVRFRPGAVTQSSRSNFGFRLNAEVASLKSTPNRSSRFIFESRQCGDDIETRHRAIAITQSLRCRFIHPYTAKSFMDFRLVLSSAMCGAFNHGNASTHQLARDAWHR